MGMHLVKGPAKAEFIALICIHKEDEHISKTNIPPGLAVLYLPLHSHYPLAVPLW